MPFIKKWTIVRSIISFFHLTILALMPSVAIAQFTWSNLTVLQVGPGTTNAATQIAAVEYTTSGVQTYSVALPSSGADAITNSGSATSEGAMSLSAERDRLVIQGYNAAAGVTGVASTSATVNPRVLYTINPTGAYGLAGSSTTLYNSNNIRGGTASGLDYFGCGTPSGISYFNTNTANLTSSITNTRAVQILNGQIYFSSSSGAYLGVSKLGSGINTTTGQSATLLANSSSAFGFSISPDGAILYLADDASGIKRYVQSGAAYILDYTVNSTNSRGLCADYSGANPIIYATTAAPTYGNNIIKITDVGAGSPATVIATAPANHVFRGIQFSPSCKASIAISTTTVCPGAGATVTITGNPTGIVSYNINGGATITATITNNGILTFPTGPLTTNSTYNLLTINTTACSSSSITGSATVTVNTIPAITGSPALCEGTTTLQSNPTTGGVWISSNNAVATISTTGLVTGVSAGTTIITYSTSCGSAERVVTVNPLPPAIFGDSAICVGVAALVSNSVAGGTWAVSNTLLADINSTSGVVTGITSGTAVITYTLPSGCYTTKPLTVNPLPTAITGPDAICTGSETNLYSAGSGLWSSGSPDIATVGSADGRLHGFTDGIAVITYTLPTGCLTTKTISVHPTPAPISGVTNLCVGNSTPMSNTLSGGSWASSNALVAIIDPVTGSISGLTAGTTIITYSMPTGCFTIRTFSVLPLPGSLSSLSSDFCVGSTAAYTNSVGGGVWSSSNIAVATIGSASGLLSCAAIGTSTITYSLPTGCYSILQVTIGSSPAAIVGPDNICMGLPAVYTDATLYGQWSSSNNSIATIGTATGIVTTITPGTATITYQITPYCLTSKTITIHALPGSITGSTDVCVGQSIFLNNTSAGNWTSSATYTATVDSITGRVTGLSPGSATITFTTPAGCIATKGINVNPTPSIIGLSRICPGVPVAYNADITGGTWLSSATGVAVISSISGIVTGISIGTTILTYHLPTGCFASAPATVIAPPAAISGANTVCSGNTSLYTSSGAGTWSSSATGVAIIDSTTGLCSALSAGTSIISYTASPTCYSTKPVTIYASPAAIAGVRTICPGGNTLLSNAIAGGFWTASNSLVNVNSSTGRVYGVGIGTCNITYALPPGCRTLTTVTINPTVPNLGPSLVCTGSTITLTNSIPGGTWVSSDIAHATVSGGIVTGVTTGVAIITYTTPSGCYATTNITVIASPAAIVGLNQICSAASATLSSSTPGGRWQSSDTIIATIDSVTGNASGINAGATVITYRVGSGCFALKTLTVHPLPAVIVGDTTLCLGSSTILTNSSAGGNWRVAGSLIAHIDSTIGMITGIGIGRETVSYTLPTGCATTASMRILQTPINKIVTGGGAYCTGGSGVAVRLLLADTGNNYQLYRGSTPVGSILLGTGADIDFGLQSLPGFYSITAINVATSCVAKMNDSVSIALLPLPIPYALVGGGRYCAVDTGLHIGIINSETGINYQLLKNGTPFGFPYAGNGAALDFGLFSTAGVYSVSAINTTTGCANNMTGGATIAIDTPKTPNVSISFQEGASTLLDTLKATVSNIDTGLAYQWIINGTYIGGANSPTFITELLRNSDSVSCLVIANNYCGSELGGASTIVRKRTVAVEQVVNNHYAVNIFPNPTDGNFNLSVSGLSGCGKTLKLAITDMTGRQILNDIAEIINGAVNKSINLGINQHPGLYMLTIETEECAIKNHYAIVVKP